MIASLVNESVISHSDEIEIIRGRAPKIEFRVSISFEDEEGQQWSIDKVFEAAPRKDWKYE